MHGALFGSHINSMSLRVFFDVVKTVSGTGYSCLELLSSGASGTSSCSAGEASFERETRGTWEEYASKQSCKIHNIQMLPLWSEVS